MNRIEKEMNLLLRMAADHRLPSYPMKEENDSFYAEAPANTEPIEYFSGEISALECRLKSLWANDPELTPCIPLVLAAIEKSRDSNGHAIIYTVLYNYTM